MRPKVRGLLGPLCDYLSRGSTWHRIVREIGVIAVTLKSAIVMIQPLGIVMEVVRIASVHAIWSLFCFLWSVWYHFEATMRPILVCSQQLSVAFPPISYHRPWSVAVDSCSFNHLWGTRVQGRVVCLLLGQVLGQLPGHLHLRRSLLLFLRLRFYRTVACPRVIPRCTVWCLVGL